MNSNKQQFKLLKIFSFVCISVIYFQSCDDEPVELVQIIDNDNDGIEESADNCPLIANPNQEDLDNDGIGDLCDEDDDNDGIFDINDNCTLIANPNQEDDDNDGIGNLCDDDYVDPNIPLAPCIDGFADIYPCSDYDLMSRISLETVSASSANDSWGWTDPMTGNEYALLCLNNGTAFIDITIPSQPIYLGKLPTATSSTVWRDVKVYNNYAYIVSEATNHGMQLFDLTRLRNVTNPPETFTSDNRFTGFGSAHNIVINEDSGYAYAVGATTYGGGPHFINIQNTSSPIDEGGYSAAQYSHDAQVINYNGPDADYIGREIYIGCQAYIGLFTILDVTDKNNIIPISTISYPNPVLPHQGWFTDNQRYFIAGDEGDEGAGKQTRTLVFDFSDLDSPILHLEYLGPTTAIDHNGYIKETTFYLANYRAGVRMIDISNLDSSSMTEIGFFDTYPENDLDDFDGAWNVYPYFPSGNIIISDINRGLFVVKKSN